MNAAKNIADFKQAVVTHDIHGWHIRDCSMCGCPLCYLFRDGGVFFDAGCDCTGRSSIEPRSWRDIADLYNNNLAREPFIAKANGVFRFETSANTEPKP